MALQWWNYLLIGKSRDFQQNLSLWLPEKVLAGPDSHKVITSLEPLAAAPLGGTLAPHFVPDPTTPNYLIPGQTHSFILSAD